MSTTAVDGHQATLGGEPAASRTRYTVFFCRTPATTDPVQDQRVEQIFGAPVVPDAEWKILADDVMATNRAGARRAGLLKPGTNAPVGPLAEALIQAVRDGDRVEIEAVPNWLPVPVTLEQPPPPPPKVRIG